jgi:hypothetical protein
MKAAKTGLELVAETRKIKSEKICLSAHQMGEGMTEGKS